MQEPTDDQLDGLFRKSAEEFNAPFDPVAWEALRSRLDSHDRLTIGEHLLRWGLPVLLLLFLTGGSWNAHRQRAVPSRPTSRETAGRQLTPVNGDPTPAHPVQRRQPQPGNDALPSGEQAVNPSQPNRAETSVGQAQESQQAVLTAVPGEPIRTQGEKVVGLPVVEKRNRSTTAEQKNEKIRPARTKTVAKSSYRATPTHASVVSRTSTKSRTKRTRPGTSEQQPRWLAEETGNRGIDAIYSATSYAIASAKSFSKRRVESGLATEQLIKELPDVNDQILSVNAAVPIVSPSFAELTNRTGQWPKPISFTNREVTAPVITAEPKQSLSTQPATVQKGLSVRFMVSPDLSAIGLRNFQRPGTNIGLLLEYRLASRWSVQAGIMRSTKVYKALTTDYELPAYVAKWPAQPESVNGRCNMIDIPINLRYDVVLRPRLNGLTPSRWFVSGGMTTYIMQQEVYIYDYADKDKPLVTPNMEGWNGNTGRLYDFSQLNLSAGYERALNQRLSWQVEPFMKAPLKGVGHYKINLLSTGAFFSLRYKL